MPWIVAVPGLLALAGLSVLICWIPASHLLAEWHDRDWPVVQARVVSGHVEPRHEPARGRKSAWSGWCVRWTAVYAWQGTERALSVDDPAPSTFAPGCFAFRSGAEAALARHAIASTLPLRVDPADPWETSTQPAGLHGADIALLLYGLCPIGLPLAAGLWGLHARRRARHETKAAAPTPDPR